MNNEITFMWVTGPYAFKINEMPDKLKRLGNFLKVPFNTQIEKFVFLPYLKSRIVNKF